MPPNQIPWCVGALTELDARRLRLGSRAEIALRTCRTLEKLVNGMIIPISGVTAMLAQHKIGSGDGSRTARRCRTLRNLQKASQTAKRAMSLLDSSSGESASKMSD